MPGILARSLRGDLTYPRGTHSGMTREASGPSAPDLAALFHRLNNQLGVILANAELVEARGPDRETSARAGQIVASAVEAITTAREIRGAIERSSSAEEPDPSAD